MRDFASLHSEGWLQRRGAEVCLAVGFSPVFAWLRPSAFDEQAFLARFGYWGGLLLCWFMAMAAVEALLVHRRWFQDLVPLARRALVIGLAAFPMILIAGAATNALNGSQVNISTITQLYWQIVLIGSIVALLAKAVLPSVAEQWATEPVSALVEASRQAPVAVDSEAASSSLTARLPLAVRGRLICLEMEDHYVRVHTDRGSALVLLRLRDAIAKAEAVMPGRQVHRSWWVSDEAIQRFERVGRTGQLHLSGGIKAPVSQRYLKLVESACAAKNRLETTTQNAPAAME